MTVPEAELKQTDAGLIPQGEGWFVLNARDASWIRSEERGQDTDFQGGQEWAELGFRIQILMRGQRGMYHGERGPGSRCPARAPRFESTTPRAR